jgi:hypothetical protein
MHDGDALNHDSMDDDALDAMRRVLSDGQAPGPPPLEAIAAKAQALRRRRRSGLAAAGSAAAGVAITAALLAAPGHPATTHLGSGPVHVNLADFSVDSNADGTVRLDLSAKRALDAPQLAGVLAQAGVPAVVRVGAFCGVTISPSGLHQAIVNIVAVGSGSASSRVTPQRKAGGFLIRPSAIPKNAEVSIDYSADRVTVGLVAANRPLTCVVSRAVKCAEFPAGAAAATTLPEAATTLPEAAATTLPEAAATTLAEAATTLPAPATTLAPATTMPATTGAAPIGGPPPGATTAVGPGALTWTCEAQVLQPAAYAATTTST